MKLDEAISHAEGKLRAYMRDEKARLVADIEAMRHQHAAKGMLLSGNTLRRICDLGIESLVRRVEQTFAVITTAIESVEPRVKNTEALMPVILKFIPEDLDDQALHIRKAVSEINAPNALPQLLGAISNARTNELQKSKAELELVLGRNGNGSSSSKHSRIFGTFDAISVLVTLVLAALWIKNPSGPYEPYLALVVAIATVGNLLRKSLRQND